MTRYGVSDAIWRQILDTCVRFPEVERVILYGSRARGDDGVGSDIDLAIDAPNMPHQTFALLWNALDDLPIIFFDGCGALTKFKEYTLASSDTKRRNCVGVIIALGNRFVVETSN